MNLIRRWLVTALLLPCMTAIAGEQQVTIATADPEVRLAGTLQWPEGAVAPPIAVLVTGTGNHCRDQVVSRVPMFAQLATRLEAAGIASLRVDSRGSCGSTGPKALESTTSDRVQDTRAVVDWLRNSPPRPFGSIGLIGHSEGAAIAAELGGESGVAWTVLLGAPARPGRTVWVEQQAAGAASALEGNSEALPRIRALLDQAALRSIEGAEQEEQEAIAADLFAELGIDEASARADGSIAGFAKRMTDPWMRAFLAYDPQPALSRLRTPVLAVYGASDKLTPPAQNAGRLVELVSSDPNADLTLRVLPAHDHFFLMPAVQPASASEGSAASLSPTLGALVVEWIHGRMTES